MFHRIFVIPALPLFASVHDRDDGALSCIVVPPVPHPPPRLSVHKGRHPSPAHHASPTARTCDAHRGAKRHTRWRVGSDDRLAQFYRCLSGYQQTQPGAPCYDIYQCENATISLCPQRSQCINTKSGNTRNTRVMCTC